MVVLSSGIAVFRLRIVCLLRKVVIKYVGMTSSSLLLVLHDVTDQAIGTARSHYSETID